MVLDREILLFADLFDYVGGQTVIESHHPEAPRAGEVMVVVTAAADEESMAAVVIVDSVENSKLDESLDGSKDRGASDSRIGCADGPDQLVGGEASIVAGELCELFFDNPSWSRVAFAELIECGCDAVIRCRSGLDESPSLRH